MNKKLILFDVDGTLTVPREKITEDMLEVLIELKKQDDLHIGFVGGSDLVKQIEQLGEKNLELFYWRFSENGLLGYKDNKKIHSQSFKDFMGEKHFMKFINIILKNLSNIEIPIKRGTFIEFRNGMLNVSPIGRACSRDERNEFEKYDNKHLIRKNLIKNIKSDWEKYCFEYKDSFPKLNEIRYSIGGQISFDVFPEGWDKTYCLKFVENDYNEIHFFGDKSYYGGNDYEIYNDERTIGHSVNTYLDTIKILKKQFNL